MMAAAVAVAAACGGDDGGSATDAAAVYQPMTNLERDVVDTTLAVDHRPQRPRHHHAGAVDLDRRLVRDRRPRRQRGPASATRRSCSPTPAIASTSACRRRRRRWCSRSTTPTASTTPPTAWPWPATPSPGRYHCGNVFPLPLGAVGRHHVPPLGHRRPRRHGGVPGRDRRRRAVLHGGVDRRRVHPRRSGPRPAGTRVAMWHRAGEASAAAIGGAHLRASVDWIGAAPGAVPVRHRGRRGVGQLGPQRLRRHGASPLLARGLGGAGRRGRQRPRGRPRLVRQRHPHPVPGRTSCSRKVRPNT